jgi:hypothetical protein
MPASDTTPERIFCKHCNGTGTCSTGLNGVACAVCAKRGSKFRDYSEVAMGLPCLICEGRGSIEPFSLKLHNRFLPFFAMGFVTLLLFLVGYAVFADKSFDKVIGFAGTLIGSITGYYFGIKPVTGSATAPKKDHSNDKPQDKK